MRYKSIAARLRSITCIVILLLLISILNYYLTGLADSIEDRYHRITDLETLFAHIVADEWINLNNSLNYNEPDIRYEEFKHNCEFFSKNCGEDIIAERQKIFERILNIEKQSAKLYIDVRNIMSDMISTVKYTHEHHIAYLQNLMRRGVVKQDYDTGESFMRSPFQSASELDIIKAAVNIQTKLFDIYEFFQKLHEVDNPMQVKKKFIKKIQEFRSSINRFEDYSLDAQDGLLVEELLINQKLFEQMFSDLTSAEHKKKKLRKTLDENRLAAWNILKTEKNRLQTASYNTSKGKKILLVISILFTISMIWWIMLAGKRIISQINRTVMETEKIRNDYSFQIRIDPEVFYEFKIVFKTLNSMAGTVNEHIRQLDETRNALEHRVQERTLELTTANKELKNKIIERILAGEQLKNLRNLLINVINSMPSVLICVDNEGKVTLWNAGAEKRTGMTLDKAKGLSVINLFPQLLKTTGMIKEAIDKQEIQKKEQFAEKLDGRTRFSDVTVYPLKGNDCNGAVIRIDDVTERVTIEEMIIQSEKMMSVGGLAAGMAHEINNPLAGILQNTQIIRNRISKDLPANIRAAEECCINMDTVRAYMEKRKILKLIESVMDSGGRAARIVDNMLSFSRKNDSRFITHDIAELLDKAIDLAASDYNLKKKYDFRKIEIVREYDPDLPETPCEESKLQQVFFNILKNGAQAMTKNSENLSPKFILRTCLDRDMARIEIEDNGPGMDKATCKRVFDPFFTTKKVGFGTGLGLSVSYFIITENHGGNLFVSSTQGKGAKFSIILPITAV